MAALSLVEAFELLDGRLAFFGNVMEDEVSIMGYSDRFLKAFNVVIVHEGEEYTNHSSDRGGETNMVSLKGLILIWI